jgi:porin
MLCPLDRKMRLSSLFSHDTSTTIVALLTVATIAATARAQLPAEPRVEIPARATAVLAEEPSEAVANRDSGMPPGTVQDSPAEATPEDSTPPTFAGTIHERSKLTGDWLGCRTGLSDGGITFDFSSTQFYQGVTTGGLEQAFEYGGRNDCFLNLDGEKLGLSKGSFVTLHGETRYGETANSLAGTLLAPNLLLALPQPSGSVTALTGVTFTQNVTDELQIYFGKFNTLDDYKQPLTGASSLTGFLNTAMLYNPVFARTVPYSTFGVGFSCLLDEEPVFTAIVYDTNDTPTVSGFDTFFDNGATIYSELNFTTTFFERPGHQGISGTYSTGTYTDLTPSAYLDPIEGVVIVPTSISGSWCLAYNIDQAVYVSPDNPERMWGVFGNFGIADDNPSPVRWFASSGISGASQIAGRPADSFGIAYFYLGVSEPLKDLAPILLPLRDEQGVELYYNMAITPWCQITPDFQVIAPFRDRADTALLFGLRAYVDF